MIGAPVMPFDHISLFCTSHLVKACLIILMYEAINAERLLH